MFVKIGNKIKIEEDKLYSIEEQFKERGIPQFAVSPKSGLF